MFYCHNNMVIHHKKSQDQLISFSFLICMMSKYWGKKKITCMSNRHLQFWVLRLVHRASSADKNSGNVMHVHVGYMVFLLIRNTRRTNLLYNQFQIVLNFFIFFLIYLLWYRIDTGTQVHVHTLLDNSYAFDLVSAPTQLCFFKKHTHIITYSNCLQPLNQWLDICAQFHGYAYRRILRYRSRFPARLRASAVFLCQPCKRRIPSNVKYVRAEAKICR